MAGKRGTTRKQSLSPVEREILWILSEAGEEDIACMINTLCGVLHDFECPRSLKTLQRSIRHLRELGFVEASLGNVARSDSWVAVSEDQIDQVLDLDVNVAWNAGSKTWRWIHEFWDGKVLYLTLTNSGVRSLLQ